MTYGGSVRADVPPELDAASIWFRTTGEIWGFQTHVGGEYRGRQVFYGDYIPEQWVSFVASGLNKLVNVGAIGPYRVRVGVTGLDGLHWDNGQSLGWGEPPIALEPSLESEFTATSDKPEDWKIGLISAWTELRRIFAMPAPDEATIETAFRSAGS